MEIVDNLIGQLKKKGFRFTKIRKALLELLVKSHKPLSSPEILRTFSKKGITVNKTTIYRELTTLKDNNIVSEIQLGDNTKRYEVAHSPHHHHLICLACKKIEDLIMEKDLDREEEKINQSKGFRVVTHSLEFFGLCGVCDNRTQLINK